MRGGGGAVPHPVLDRIGGYPILSQTVVPHPVLSLIGGGGIPSSPGCRGVPILLWMQGGTPPPILTYDQTWMGGIPSCHGWVPPGKGPGSSGSIIWWRWGTPLWTDRHLWNSPFPILRMRAVNILFSLWKRCLCNAVVVVWPSDGKNPESNWCLLWRFYLCASNLSVTAHQ